MTHALRLLLILWFLASGFAIAGERRLHGQVERLDETTRRVPAPQNIEVVIPEIGASHYTDSNGLFDYFLRDRDKPGKDVTFVIKLPDHIVQDPVDGKTTIPTDNKLDKLIRILLVKRGSSSLLTYDRFCRTVEDGTRKARDQVKPDETEPQLPVELKVDETAFRLGFTVEEFFQWWRKQADALESSPDPQARARAATAKGRFKKAADLEMQAMEQQAQIYVRKRPMKQHRPEQSGNRAVLRLVQDSTPAEVDNLEELAWELFKGFRFAGDAYYNAYEFKTALNVYEGALEYISKEDLPALWATTQIDIHRTRAEIRKRFRCPGSEKPDYRGPRNLCIS